METKPELPTNASSSDNPVPVQGKKKIIKFIKKAKTGNINTQQNFADIVDMDIHAKSSFSIVKDATRKSSPHDLNTHVSDIVLITVALYSWYI